MPERVPVVGRGVDHRIDALVVEDPPEVLGGLRGLALGLLDGLLRRPEPPAVGVADPGDLDIGPGGEHLGHLPAAASHAHERR